MIYVEVHYFVKKGQRDAFYQAVKEAGIIACSSSEQGNRKYDYYFSPVDPDEICLLEVWDTIEDQKAHGQTENMKKLQALKAEYVERAVLNFYEAKAMD